VGRYKERLVSGPGGLGRGRVWVPEKEGEQHNLILTQTYDTLIAQYGFVALGNYAVVGTGSTAPDPSQTGLVSEVARTSADTSPVQSNDAEPTYGQFVFTRVREFTEAQVGGRNLTEWGFSPSSASGGNLMCRELFRDGSGNPVVLTLDTDQRLRLIYKYSFTYTPALGSAQDVSVNVAGIGVKTAKLFISRNIADSYTMFGHLSLLDEWAAAKTGNIRYLHLPVARTPNPDAGAVSSSSSITLGSSWFTQITRGRKVNSRTFAASEANETWYGLEIYRLISGYGARGAVFLAFDAGQEFTKSNLYKIVVNEWVLTWGP